MILCQTSYSQQVYPQKIKIDSTELILITPIQLGLINGKIIENELLEQELAIKDSLLIFNKSLLKAKDSLILNLNSVVRNDRLMIKNLELSSQLKDDLLSAERKRLNRQKWLYGGGGAAIGIVLTLLLVK